MLLAQIGWDLTLDYLARIAASFLPVVAFLVTLNFIDSFKLVRQRVLWRLILIGSVVAVLSLLVNRLIADAFSIEDIAIRQRYIAPVVEEILKCAYIAFLIRTHRVGFMVDAAIAGFAIGAGFAIVENAYYIQAVEDSNLWIWIIRGFGTAIMHGGTTALFAIISKGIYDRGHHKPFVFWPGLVIAILIHMGYNHFFLHPILATVMIHVVLPLILAFAFAQSERITRKWMGHQFDNDQEILEIINSGHATDSKLGTFFAAAMEHFPSEMVVDILCYLRLHIELAISAKGMLMMREAGFDPKPRPGTEEKFAELRFLEKSIGTAGRLAIAPLLHSSSHDLWQLHMLKGEGERAG